MRLYIAIRRVEGHDVVTRGTREQLGLESNERIEDFFEQAQVGDWMSLDENEDIVLCLMPDKLNW